MKGIKECLNALADGKTLVCVKDERKDGSALGDKIKIYEAIEALDDYLSRGIKAIRWLNNHKDRICLTVLEECEWEEVKEPISWEEAVKDCEENGTRYLNWYGEGHNHNNIYEMYNSGIRVKIKTLQGDKNITVNCKWVKK